MNRTTPPLSGRVAAARRLARSATLAGAALLVFAVLATPAHAAAAHPNIAVSVVGDDVAFVGGPSAWFAVYVDNIGQATAVNPKVHISVSPALYGRVDISGPYGPGKCAKKTTGLVCTLGSLEPGEVNLADNTSELKTDITGWYSTTKATAPPSVRAGQPFTIHAEVKSDVDGVTTLPTGTVTVTGADGVTSAPLAQKSPGSSTSGANVTLVATHRGLNTFVVKYPGSSLFGASRTTVKVKVL
jgi:hypothetical protein